MWFSVYDSYSTTQVRFSAPRFLLRMSFPSLLRIFSSPVPQTSSHKVVLSALLNLNQSTKIYSNQERIVKYHNARFTYINMKHLSNICYTCKNRNFYYYYFSHLNPFMRKISYIYTNFPLNYQTSSNNPNNILNLE